MNDSKSTPFSILLNHLDRDETAAAEKLSALRSNLSKTLTKKGCPESETDRIIEDTLKRVTEEVGKIKDELARGIIRENDIKIKRINDINGYSVENAENVLHKYFINCLIDYLDTDWELAWEKYLILQMKITKTLIWKGCPESAADKLADDTLDRAGKKIVEIDQKLAKGITVENGKEIKKIENINSYIYGVARFVWQEYYRKELKNRDGGDDNPPVIAVEPDELLDEPDLRLRCLRTCLAEKIPNDLDKQLILGYYYSESGEKAKVIREKLREKLGITKGSMKVRACLLRQKLEKCINGCVERLNKKGKG